MLGRVVRMALTGASLLVVMDDTAGSGAALATVDEVGAVLPPPPPATASWGAITGTLSAQADLQTALNAKGTSNFDGAYASLSGKPTLGSAAATVSTPTHSGTPTSVVQPYLVVAMWQRTA